MLERQKANPWRMALLGIEDDGERLPFYSHAVLHEGRPVGVITSGGYGFRTNKVLALAYLRPGVSECGFGVSILGKELAARELLEAPYDPRNLRLRGLEHLQPAASV
jgi:dimethylglycine dehydrogenase